MKLGTVSYEGKIYNLDNIKIEEVKTIMDKMESSKNQLIKSIEKAIGKSGSDAYSTLMKTFSEAESFICVIQLATLLKLFLSVISYTIINPSLFL